jgi:hypothetical protein
MREYNLTEEELEFALNKAKGIIYGYAMEFRAIRILEKYNFTNIKYVDMPTHDIEAEKNGMKFYIEVKATSKSPTKEYSPHKVIMIGLLDGEHLTLLMKPKELLVPTRQILSEPKLILYEFVKNRSNYEFLQKFLGNPKYLGVLKGYYKALKDFSYILPENILEVLRLSP